MSLLITGGAGFIGCHLIERLLMDDISVVVLTKNKDRISKILPYAPQLAIYDITSPLPEIFDAHPIDTVIHLATYYKKVHTPSDIPEMIQTNMTLPISLLEEMAKRNVPYFINTGTFFSYKFGIKEPLSENSEISPYNLYAAFKIGFAETLKYYCHHHNIKAITLRLFSPYGEKDRDKFIVYLINRLLHDQPAGVTQGEQVLSWTYVKDIVDAYCRCLVYLPTMQDPHETFNIGSDGATPLSWIYDILEEISGKNNLIHRGKKAYRPNEIMYGVSDSTKARTKLNWKPQYSLREGLAKTYAYYQQLNKK